mmetsp:Transcript_8522/g.26750  ORF Transcript_8522/g.26750 Transcript_8522/m.26750 type:complete len:274 (+) Transcript_8522:358-1179(+)
MLQAAALSAPRLQTRAQRHPEARHPRCTTLPLRAVPVLRRSPPARRSLQLATAVMVGLRARPRRAVRMRPAACQRGCLRRGAVARRGRISDCAHGARRVAVIIVVACPAAALGANGGAVDQRPSPPRLPPVGRTLGHLIVLHAPLQTVRAVRGQLAARSQADAKPTRRVFTRHPVRACRHIRRRAREVLDPCVPVVQAGLERGSTPVVPRVRAADISSTACSIFIAALGPGCAVVVIAAGGGRERGDAEREAADEGDHMAKPWRHHRILYSCC